MNAIGPGTDNCGRYKLSDALNEPVEELTFFIDDAGLVKGMKVKTKAKIGTFGDADLAQKAQFSFTAEQPLIGIWGYDGASSISGIGIIKFDTTSQCYEELEFKNKVDEFHRKRNEELVKK